MAATLAQLNHYLQNTLLIVDTPIWATLNAQGLQNIDDFLTLTDDDIGDICMNAQKPGGMIPNPKHNPVNPVAGIPVTIPNPGMLIDHVYNVEKLQFSFSMVASPWRSLTLLALPVAFLEIACLHVSFTENFYRLSKNALSSCKY